MTHRLYGKITINEFAHYPQEEVLALCRKLVENLDGAFGAFIAGLAPEEKNTLNLILGETPCLAGASAAFFYHDELQCFVGADAEGLGRWCDEFYESELSLAAFCRKMKDPLGPDSPGVRLDSFTDFLRWVACDASIWTK